MSEGDSSADDVELGAYGRHSWLSDAPDADDAVPAPPAEPRNPFAPSAPVRPTVDAPPPPPLAPPAPPAAPDARPAPEPPAGPRRRGGPRWAGRRRGAEPTDATATWWTPAVVAPSVPPIPVRSGGFAAGPSATVDRVRGEGVWTVVDTGSSVSVSGLQVVPAGLLLRLVLPCGAVAVFAALNGGGELGGIFVVAILVAAVAFGVSTVTGSRCFLRADEQGLHLRSGAFARTTTTVPWDDVAGLGSRTYRGSWPRPEAWFVITRDGKRLRVWAQPGQRSWNPYAALRKIMIGVALFPLRLGRPALLIDGIPGPDPYGHLPPPPDPSA